MRLTGFEHLDDWPLRDTSPFSERVASLRQQLIANGLDPAALDDMTLTQMIASIRGDILRWRIEKTLATN